MFDLIGSFNFMGGFRVSLSLLSWLGVLLSVPGRSLFFHYDFKKIHALLKSPTKQKMLLEKTNTTSTVHSLSLAFYLVLTNNR